MTVRGPLQGHSGLQQKGPGADRSQGLKIEASRSCGRFALPHQ
jgi:hypothetical protein